MEIWRKYGFRKVNMIIWRTPLVTQQWKGYQADNMGTINIISSNYEHTNNKLKCLTFTLSRQTELLKPILLLPQGFQSTVSADPVVLSTKSCWVDYWKAILLKYAVSLNQNTLLFHKLMLNYRLTGINITRLNWAFNVSYRRCMSLGSPDWGVVW